MQTKNLNNTINIDRIKYLEESLKRSKEDLDKLNDRIISDEFISKPEWSRVKTILSRSYNLRLKELKRAQKNLTIC